MTVKQMTMNDSVDLVNFCETIIPHIVLHVHQITTCCMPKILKGSKSTES